MTMTSDRSDIEWRYTYAVILLAMANVFNYMDRMILSVVADPIKRELGLSDTQLGFLTGFAFVAIYAAVGLPIARLADKYGRRWVLAGSLAVWSIMTASSGTSGSFFQLALFRTGVGVGEAGGMPSSYALLAEMYPPKRRAVPIAFMTAGACVGISAGLALGGYVASHYGWRTAFVAVGLPGVVLAAIVALTLPEPRFGNVSANAVDNAGFLAAVTELFQARTYRWLVIAHPFYLFATAGLVGWLPLFFIRSHGMSLESVGLLFGIAYGLGLAIGVLAGAWILQRISRERPERALFWAGWLLILAFPMFVAAVLLPDRTASLILVALFGALSGGASAPLVAGQQGVIRSDSRAVGAAVSMFIAAYLGSGLGPLLIGMGSDAFVPIFGTNALRASLTVASLAIIPPGLCMIMASRHFVAEMTN